MDPGYLLDDRYEIEQLIGKGGHGKVYKALDRHLHSPVAIKVLYGDVAKEREFRVRMEREARAMGQLAGTSAVQVMAFNRTAWGALYLVMEYLDGHDLGHHLRLVEKDGRRLPLRDLHGIMEPVVLTLQAAHERGIIHRDVKAANVFVMKSAVRGRSRLLDFGLAKDISLDPLTRTGMIAGSPAYIAPEAWNGRPAPIDHRVDVYSLGVLLFRLMTGRFPFDPNKPIDQLLVAVTRGARPSLSADRADLPPEIDVWVGRALAIDRERRFHSVLAMWESLVPLLRA
ncbi:MAG: serine/threonine protein kinase [Myxococcales bacterium]|nr:serine/threonine protein kinase [Myxococcales bacterium]